LSAGLAATVKLEQSLFDIAFSTPGWSLREWLGGPFGRVVFGCVDVATPLL
jgi:hypothetical protein